MNLDNLNDRQREAVENTDGPMLILALGADDVEESDRKAIELGVDVLATDRPELFVKKYRPEHTWTK